jgi:membrane protease subunit HflK
VTRDRIYLETMQQVYSNASKVYVDQKAGSSMLFLPLDKIMQMSGSAAAESAAPSGEAQPSAPSAVDPRSRETFRNRDREGRP